jgi:hypothetical protein
MKYIIVIAAFASLSACKPDTPDTREKQMSEQGLSYAVECIDGVEYWKRDNGHAGYLSPRINSETLAFMRCGEKQ